MIAPQQIKHSKKDNWLLEDIPISAFAKPIKQQYITTNALLYLWFQCGSIFGFSQQSCKKYRNLGTKFPENSKTWQKNVQHSFVRKDITTVFFAISLIKEQIFVNFSTADQKVFIVLWNVSNQELSNFGRPF